MISIRQTMNKDKIRRYTYRASEQKRRFYKICKMLAHVTGEMPMVDLSIKKLKNHCLISGRARGVYSKHIRLSRHMVKKHFILVKGFRNASW